MLNLPQSKDVPWWVGPQLQMGILERL
jgi:hypothetical protein